MNPLRIVAILAISSMPLFTAILKRREAIKQKTIAQRRRLHLQAIAA
jgi:hypothetical protein